MFDTIEYFVNKGLLKANLEEVSYAAVDETNSA